MTSYIDDALKSVTTARDYFVMKHCEEFNIDWCMEQFNTVTEILERLREYDKEVECDG